VAVAALADPGGQNAAERASFSNYGWWVDAAAPGQNVVSTFLDDGYAAWSGTSFAAPYVCGRIAALMTDKDMAVQDAVRELFDPNRGEHLPDLGVLLY
ncbi:MAG: S8 family serine peptidase, partial [Catenulispora sp.]|nr:S8 family serine peptidase [Catenulispora sp.]